MAAGNKQQVLVIQAQDDIRQLVSGKLESMGHHALPAATLSEASRILDNERVGIILFGFEDFGADGEKYLSEVNRVYPGTCIIATLPEVNHGAAARAIRSGADHHMVLPGDLARFGEVLEVAAERNYQRNELRTAMDKLARMSEDAEKEKERAANLVEQNFLDTVKAFIGLLETRDLHIGSHCKRVASFTRSLADQYDLSDRVKHEIEVGALLHDIGKMSIPDQILIKTRSFFSKVEITNKERDIYRQHPVIGQETVEMVNMLSNVGVYIRHHHERFDGQGFPDGLEGFHIPLGARIITIVDAYDKIVYSLPKNKQSEAELLFIKFVEKNKGVIFDPEVSRKMNVLMNELKRQEYSEEHRVTIANLTPSMVLARDVYTKNGVLVISQYERVTGNDIARLTRFLTSNMILDGVYVFGLDSGKTRPVMKKTAATITSQDTGEGNIAEVYAAIDSTRDFSTLAEVHATIARKMQDPKFTSRDIAATLQRCPVMSLRVLRLANSPMFSMSGKVRNIGEAVKLLGMNEVKRITLSTPIIQENAPVVEQFEPTAFWMHLLGCGVVSGIIARHIGAKRVNEYFTAGIYHDIGKLALIQLFPQKLQRVVDLVRTESMFYRKAERVVFGEPHTAIGAYLLAKWNLPEEIVDAVKCHHAPMDSSQDPTLASAVHLADIITHMLHIGDSGERTVPKLEPFAERKLGISLADLEQIIPDIDQELKKSRDMIFSNSLNAKPDASS